ncbi:glycosyltransferase family 39 protein [Kitasatospora viridis]|uniref:Dolichyl-phosphate-mannose-protein mannosyltransferase n=1 Tax=Kitasatospora viridis TaxID=281105 RepID=A0A561UJM0_9ACTN|nr:glycosyltransferase family 39 protein [Kitasatospora viridis]TWF99560.1 dolichyl-phosphate-mannose-protein mannosyltransferase [Kitasatospora viridis]
MSAISSPSQPDRAPSRDEAGAPPPGAGGWPALRAVGRRAAPALAVFTAAKASGFAVFLALLAGSKSYAGKNAAFGGGAHAWEVLGSWDGKWYQRIAVQGYHPESIAAVGGIQHLHQNSVAFFPLYPALIRLVGECTGLGAFGAGLVVAVLSSMVAAVALYLIAEKLAGPRTGLITAALWAVLPGSGVEWAVYSDSLFVALAALACYCVMTRRWLHAGALTCVAGLNRPTSAALIGAVVLAAAIALGRREDGWRPLGAILIAPWGLIGYLGWVGYRMGALDAYTTLERTQWGHYFDWGQYTFHTSVSLMLGKHLLWADFEVPNLIALLLLLSLPVLVVLMLQLRLPAVLNAYALLTIALVVPNAGLYCNYSRYLLPAFPLFLALAYGLRRVRLPALAVTIGVLAAASGWYAGFALFELGAP